MARHTGFGNQYDFDEAPGKKVFSPDGKRAAAYWIGRKHEDRYDLDVTYDIYEWDVASKERVASYTRGYTEDQRGGAGSGKKIRSLRYGPDGALRIVFVDGSEESAKGKTSAELEAELEAEDAAWRREQGLE